MPGCAVDRNRAHDSAHAGPLAILLAAGDLAERENTGRWQRACAQYAKLPFAYDGRELSRPGYAFHFDEFAPVMIESRGHAAFDVNSRGTVLHKKIRGWHVVSDDPSNSYRITASCLLGRKLAYLLCLREKRKWRLRRLWRLRGRLGLSTNRSGCSQYGKNYNFRQARKCGAVLRRVSF
jgi:hypothetical protein